MLTTVHQPFDTRIFHKESKSLQKAGHTVTLIAPSDTASKNNVDGIHVITVKKPGLKILHPITMLRVFIAGLRQDCDVYHCHEPGSLFVCALLKLLRRTKLVYDAHEHYPSLIADNTIFPRPVKKYVEAFSNLNELLLCRFADSIIVVREDLKERFEKVTNKKISIIYVYPTKSFFQNGMAPRNMIEKYDQNKVIIYEGYVDIAARGLDKLLFALKKVVEIIPGAKVVIVGKIPDADLIWVEEYIDTNELHNNFEMVGWVDHDEVPQYLGIADVGVMLLQPIRYNNIMGIPNKIFDYMASSVPIIASDFPNIHKIVAPAKAGILVNPVDVDEIVDAILYLLNNEEHAIKMGVNGRKMVEGLYNWENMEKELHGVYESLDVIQND
jgi:glycosyltransferase involved in cell wall biosynthesis